jgi:hypothetical protein
MFAKMDLCNINDTEGMQSMSSIYREMLIQAGQKTEVNKLSKKLDDLDDMEYLEAVE